MAKVGVFSVAPRKKFKFDDDTVVELEFISKERMAKIIAKADTAAKKVGGVQSVIYDMFLGKAAVHGWNHMDQVKNPGHAGLTLPNGSQLPFSEENRNMLMKSCSEFSTFVFRTCTDSSKFLEDVLELDDQKSLDDLVNETDLEDGEEKNG